MPLRRSRSFTRRLAGYSPTRGRGLRTLRLLSLERSLLQCLVVSLRSFRFLRCGFPYLRSHWSTDYLLVLLTRDRVPEALHVSPVQWQESELGSRASEGRPNLVLPL